MPTVIDSLVVTLGLDPKGFTQGQKQAAAAFLKTKTEATKTAKDIEAAGKQAAEFFSKIRNEALALIGVLVGATGIEQFVKRMTAADAATGRLAKNLGVSTQEISAWESATERAGGSAEDAASAFQRLQDEQQQFALTGTNSINAYLRALNGLPGATQIDFNKPLEQQMRAIAQDLQLVEKLQGRPKANTIGRQLGFNQGFVNTLLQGDLEGQLGLAAKLGVATDADAAAAQKLAAAWSDASHVFTDVGRKALTELTGSLADLLTELAKFTSDNKTGILKFITDMADLIRYTVGLLRDMKDLLVWIGEYTLKGVGLATPEAQQQLFQGDSDQSLYGGGGRDLGGDLSTVGRWIDRKFNGSGAPNDTQDALAAGGAGFGTTTPRGIRNNNPLNLSYVPGQRGVTGSDGRFGKYGNMEEGIAQAERQLLLYQQRGANTLERIITKWAPPGENDTKGYIARVSQRTGFRPDQTLDLQDPETASKLIQAMAQQEVGRTLNADVVSRGVALGLGNTTLASTPDPALRVGAGAGVGPRATTNTASSEVNVQTINVNGVDTNNADSVAKGVRGGMDKYLSLTPQFNVGLQ